MEMIYKSNKETKRRGLGLDRQSVQFKEKPEHFNLEME